MESPQLSSLYQQLILEHYRNPRNKAELDEATFRMMDTDGNGAIDATEFLREFWKFGKLEHMRRDAEKKALLAEEDAAASKVMKPKKKKRNPNHSKKLDEDEVDYVPKKTARDEAK